jgi:hypothetical protein
MAPSDVSAILAQLNEVLQRLTRIEERTLVLTDHEARLRLTEVEAKNAAVDAETARGVAEALSLRVCNLEDYRTFTWTDIGRAIVVTLGAVVSILAVVAFIEVR